MTTYLVQTALVLSNGAVIPVIAHAFSDKDTAGKAAQERQKALASLLAARLVIPKGNGEADDTGLSLGEVLADLGVSRFGTNVVPMNVEDQRILLAGPGEMPKAAPSLVRP